jgi:hypothetical protein
MQVLSSLTESKTVPIRATAMATLNDWMVVVNYGIRTMCSAAASAYAEEVLPVINGGFADSCACTALQHSKQRTTCIPSCS